MTEPHDGLTVSANFWFAAVYRLLTPTRPLVPSMQCELARQLEYLVSDCLSDRARLVPAFFSALRAAVEAVHAAADARSAAFDQRLAEVEACARGVAADAACYGGDGVAAVQRVREVIAAVRGGLPR